MSTLTAQTIDLYAGEAHALNIAVTKSGVAVNLTGHVLTFETKRALPSTAADISATSAGAGAAIVVTNAAGGLAEIRLTAAHTVWSASYGKGPSVSMTFDLWDSATPGPIATGVLTLRRLPQS